MAKSKPSLDLTSMDGLVVLGCAMRYALGSRSYVVPIVIDAVRWALPSMEARDRRTLVRDIREAERKGKLGDAPEWLALAQEVEAAGSNPVAVIEAKGGAE